MDHLPMVLAYLGPETMLPMTSVVAGVAGVAMMFGRNAWSWLSTAARGLNGRRTAGPEAAREPRRIGAGPAGRVDRAGIARERARA